ncbi:MAG TPA: LLM class flavin-dependent oxidoreductase [Jiangellaceae bacterium]|nr:LLM class flavin-dependent oxidoreductase [Jiangellaceae bacterium]
MRFGVNMPNVGDPAALVELAAAADRAGWDGFFLWDHIHALPALDPWVVLGAIAQRTRTIKLGTLVTPVARRRPWKLAKEVCTLDHLSGGRVILGVGLGIPPEAEYGAFGEPTAARTHAAMLDEALPVLDSFLRGERVDHDGVYYQVHAQLSPACFQQPRPPIWVAATLPNRRPIERARRWDGIYPLRAGAAGAPSPDELAELIAELGRPEGFDVVSALSVGVAAAELAEAGVTWALDGLRSPDESWDEVRRRVDAGPPR